MLRDHGLRPRILLLVAAVAALGCTRATPGPVPPPLRGSWELVPEASAISFLSVKNGDAPVPGRIQAPTGRLYADTDGISGEVVVDLERLTTGNELRDRRIRALFFATATYPTARYRIEAIGGDLAPLTRAGGAADLVVRGKLELHGVRVPLTLPVVAVRTQSGDLLVGSMGPLALRFADYDLLAGLRKLVAVCGHRELLPLASVELHLRLRWLGPERT